MSNRFDDLRFWLGLITTVVVAGCAGVFGLFIKNLRRAESTAKWQGGY